MLVVHYKGNFWMHAISNYAPGYVFGELIVPLNFIVTQLMCG